MSGGFNSRTREGCDGLRLVLYRPKVRFNSRTREGCDSAKIAKSF